MRDKDKYIHEEKWEEPPIGLYKIVKNGGAPKIEFDDPYAEGKKPAEPAAEPAQESQPTQIAAAQEREIELLRAERVGLEEQIRAAAGPLWETEEEEPEEEEPRKSERPKPSIR